MRERLVKTLAALALGSVIAVHSFAFAEASKWEILMGAATKFAAQKEWELAEFSYQEALSAADPAHPRQVMNTLENRMHARRIKGDFSKAIEDGETLVKLYTEAVPSQSANFIRLLQELASVYWDHGEQQKAESTLASAAALAEKQPGNALALQQLDQIASLYKSWGRLEESERLRTVMGERLKNSKLTHKATTGTSLGMKQTMPLTEEGETYLSRMENALLDKWEPPTRQPEALTTTVRFYILESGKISGPRVVKSSGNKDMDQSALKALKQVSPLPKPPLSLLIHWPQKKILSEFTFDYAFRVSNPGPVSR